MLGLGGSNHDFSAALLVDGAIEVAVEDERVQRTKHGRSGWHEAPARSAAEYCLQASGFTVDELDGVFCCDDLERPVPWLDWSGVEFVNHHLAHASASYFSSPFEEAALLVVDGHGSVRSQSEIGFELETISVGHAEGCSLDLSTLQSGRKKASSNSWRYLADNSLGYFYDVVTEALGFGATGHGKTMGLAAYGRPSYKHELAQFVGLYEDGRFEFDPYGGIFDWLTETLRDARGEMQVRADIAFAAQELFVDAIVAAAREAHRRAPLRALAFGGGCALNTTANTRILAETPFEEVWVYPAAGDNGLAVGAALYGTHVVGGLPRRTRSAGWRSNWVYTGRSYSEQEIDGALASAPVFASRPTDLLEQTANALLSRQTVGICRGKSEIGPRALGNRSLIALPDATQMRDHINLNIKHRESFRPLAPVVPLECVDKYFDGITESPYMLFVAHVRHEFRARLAAVTHIDGTARVQTVRAEDNPFLHGLLEVIGEETGLPVLINTSLNAQGEPIVESPSDALRLFIDYPIDVLILGECLVRKYTPWAQPATSSPLATPQKTNSHAGWTQGRIK